jgi:hypothetical protein
MSELSQRLEAALLAAAGEGRAVFPVSFPIDYGAAAEGAEPEIETRIDRATKSLVFASAEARLADGRKAAAASAVYRVEQA